MNYTRFQHQHVETTNTIQAGKALGKVILCQSVVQIVLYLQKQVSGGYAKIIQAC